MNTSHLDANSPQTLFLSGDHGQQLLDRVQDKEYLAISLTNKGFILPPPRFCVFLNYFTDRNATGKDFLGKEMLVWENFMSRWRGLSWTLKRQHKELPYTELDH